MIMCLGLDKENNDRYVKLVSLLNILGILLLVSLCFLIYIFPNSIYAQENEFIESAYNTRPSYDPDVEVFSSVAKAVYWERMGLSAVYAGDQSSSGESYNNAIKLIEKAIKIDQKTAFLYIKLAELLKRVGDYEKSKIAAENAIELDENNADAHYLMGYIKYVKDKDKAGAINEFKKAAELNPDHLDAQNSLASLAYMSEDYSLAAKAYAHVVKIIPYNPEYRYKLGISYSETGEIDKAINELKAATMIDENHLDAHFQLAHLYANQSRNKEAIEECLYIIKRVPQYPNTMLLLAQLYVAEGEYDRAESICKELLNRKNSLKEPIIAEAYYRLGIVYKEKGDIKSANRCFDDSIEIYKNMLKSDTRNIGVNYDIAMVYDAKGDIEMAKNHLGRLILLKPDDADAHNYLGYLLVENNGDLDVAIGYIEKALSIKPDNGAFRDSLGWALYKAGRLDEAINELEKAARLAPGDSEVHEHLGEAYLKKGGEYEQRAIQEWEKALELKPNKAKLRQKLDNLYIKLGINKME